MFKSATIYSKTTCPFCVKAKKFFDDRDIAYIEKVVGAGGITKETIQKLLDDLGVKTQVKTVPQIFVVTDDGETEYVGGYSDLINKYG